MNILYYIPHLSKEHGGAYQYAIALLKILRKDMSNNYFILNENKCADVISITSKAENFKVVSVREYLSQRKWRTLLNRFKRSLGSRITPLKRFFPLTANLDFLLHEYDINIIHSPTPVIPKSILPRISTMHDVQELHFPEFFTSEERAIRAVQNRYSIDNAAKVVVSYNHIKTDIINLFSKPPDDVHVILLDMENLWIDKFTPDIALIQFPELPSKYLLYPAATWKHKNHINLLKSISYLKKEKGFNVNIVCTGNKTEHFKDIQKTLFELNLSENVNFTGIVSDGALFSLYQQAHGVVVPTLYEAGSFPLMESILLGKPVICSNVTSLPETIGYPQYIFDPANIMEMGDLILRLWQDDEFRKENACNIRLKAPSIRYNNSFEKFMNLYSSICS